ncbi:hypothetical protein [Piscirickettsia salmonis]|nr:hypothetical protein [Piscirickettsia salmonis]
MLGDFASLDVQNTYRGSDAYGSPLLVVSMRLKARRSLHLLSCVI